MAGVHNEEVSPFSEDEDDILLCSIGDVDNEPDLGPLSTSLTYDPPSHMHNVNLD